MTSSGAPSRLSAFIALLIFIPVLIGSKLIGDQVIWRFAGPVTLGLTLALLTIYMRVRGETWSWIGFRALRTRRAWLWLAPQVVLAMCAIVAAGIPLSFAGEALGFWQLDEPSAGVTERWGDIPGNLPVFLLWIAIAWISGGVFEEAFFRGFLITRFRALFGTGAGVVSGVAAVLCAALIFGYGHFYYQGVRGWVVTGAIGAALGALYLLYKRNIWPLVLAHALFDSLAFTALYADLDI